MWSTIQRWSRPCRRGHWLRELGLKLLESCRTGEKRNKREAASIVIPAQAGRWIHVSSATVYGRKPLPEFCSQDTFSKYDYRSAPNRANGDRITWPSRFS